MKKYVITLSKSDEEENEIRITELYTCNSFQDAYSLLLQEYGTDTSEDNIDNMSIHSIYSEEIKGPWYINAIKNVFEVSMITIIGCIIVKIFFGI